MQSTSYLMTWFLQLQCSKKLAFLTADELLRIDCAPKLQPRHDQVVPARLSCRQSGSPDPQTPLPKTPTALYQDEGIDCLNTLHDLSNSLPSPAAMCSSINRGSKNNSEEILEPGASSSTKVFCGVSMHVSCYRNQAVPSWSTATLRSRSEEKSDSDEIEGCPIVHHCEEGALHTEEDRSSAD